LAKGKIFIYNDKELQVLRRDFFYLKSEGVYPQFRL